MPSRLQRMLCYRWSDEAGEAQQAPQRSGPPPLDAQDRDSIHTDSDVPVHAANSQSQKPLHSRPFGGTDAQDKESLHSSESLQSKPPSLVDTQEKDPLQSQPSSSLTTQEKELIQSK